MNRNHFFFQIYLAKTNNATSLNNISLSADAQHCNLRATTSYIWCTEFNHPESCFLNKDILYIHYKNPHHHCTHQNYCHWYPEKFLHLRKISLRVCFTSVFSKVFKNLFSLSQFSQVFFRIGFLLSDAVKISSVCF